MLLLRVCGLESYALFARRICEALPYISCVIPFFLPFYIRSKPYSFLRSCRSSEDRIQLFASVDLGINVLAFTLQFFAIGWLLTRFGVVVMLAVMPIVSLLGFGVFGLATVLPVLIGFGVLRRAGEFSITKPTRETLFTVVPREEKYQAKNVIDTVVHRGADATGTGIVSMLHSWGMGLSHMAFAAMPIALLWLGTGLWLGRRHEHIRRNQ